MIDLHYWTTPNGHKVTIFLEETGLPYRIIPVNISSGEQFKPEFLKIAPNNRIPAIVDQEPADGGEPVSVFESGAILIYLGEKTGRFLPTDLRARADVLQWLMWQMGGLGPMAGQNHHFVQYAPERIPYAMERYVKETNRLYGVLDRRLADRPFVAGEYSIADMAAYPWIVPYERQQQNLDDFPNLKRWFEAIQARPAVERAYARAAEINSQPTMTEEAKKIMFGQTAANLGGEHEVGSDGNRRDLGRRGYRRLSGGCRCRHRRSGGLRLFGAALVAQAGRQLGVRGSRVRDEVLLKRLVIDPVGSDHDHAAGHDPAPAAAIYRFPESRSATGADAEGGDEDRDHRRIADCNRFPGDALAQDLFEFLQGGDHEAPHRIGHEWKSMHYEPQSSREFNIYEYNPHIFL